jgi:hypothetical protein
MIFGVHFFRFLQRKEIYAGIQKRKRWLSTLDARTYLSSQVCFLYIITEGAFLARKICSPEMEIKRLKNYQMLLWSNIVMKAPYFRKFKSLIFDKLLLNTCRHQFLLYY